MADLDGSRAGALFALGSAFAWTVISLLARVLSGRFNSATINAIRSSVGGALLVVCVLLAGGLGKLASISVKSFFLLGLSVALAVGIGDTVFFESTQRAGLGRAMTISMSYPLIAALLAVTFLGEPLTLRLAAGSLLTLGGLTLILAGRPADNVPAEGYRLGVQGAFLASVTWAVATIMLKLPLREVDALTAQAVRLPLAAAILWVIPWTRGALARLKRSDDATRWQMAGLGALTAVSSLLFAAGVKYAGVTLATVLSSTSPMFAILLGFMFLDERLKPGEILGSVATVAGVAVLSL